MVSRYRAGCLMLMKIMLLVTNLNKLRRFLYSNWLIIQYHPVLQIRWREVLLFRSIFSYSQIEDIETGMWGKKSAAFVIQEVIYEANSRRTNYLFFMSKHVIYAMAVSLWLFRRITNSTIDCWRRVEFASYLVNCLTLILLSHPTSCPIIDYFKTLSKTRFSKNKKI